MKNYDYDIIIADDNSPDSTAGIAQKLPKKYKVKVLLRKKNKGLSKSVVDGFKIAKGNIIGVMDADFTHPPEIIPKILDKLKKENADILVGSRKTKGGEIKNWPLHRKIISKFATLLAKPLTKIKDPMSGFFFLKKEVIKNIKFRPKGYKILLEILVKGNYKKAEEIPILFKDRIKGESKLTKKIYLEYLMQLIELYLYKIKKIFI
jgi:dolichol-phosphate mannosyltransferase